VSTLSDREITAFQSIDDVVIVAHINRRDGHIQTLFNSLAARYQDRASFALLETTGDSTIVCYKNKDNEQFATSDLAAISSVATFVENCLAPLIGEFSRRNELKYLQVSIFSGTPPPPSIMSLTVKKSGKSLVLYFATDAEQRQRYADSIRSIAKKYSDYLSFVTVDAIEYADMVPMLGLSPRSFPSLAVQNTANGQVFPYKGRKDLSPETVDGFVLDIVSGKVQPWTGPVVADEATNPHDEL
jgi:protein disulfide-isomerase A1